MKTLFLLIKGSRWMGGLAACLVGTAAVLFAGGLYGVASFIIAFSAVQATFDQLLVPAVAVRFFGLGRAALSYAERYLAHNETFRLLKEVRLLVYDRIDALLPNDETPMSRGTKLSLFISDVENLQDGLLRVIYPLAMAAMTGVLGTILAMAFHPLLGILFAVLFFPMPFLLYAVFLTRVQSTAAKSADEKQRLYQEVIELAAGLSDLAVLSAEGPKEAELLRHLLQSEKTQKATIHRFSLGVGLTTFYNGICSVIVLLSVAYLCTHGAFVPILASATIIGVGYLLESASQVFGIHARWDKLKESADRILAIPEAKKNETDSDEIEPLAESDAPVLRAEKIAFAYPGRRELFQDVSFTLEKGKITVLKGQSGSGKSTMISLLAGFLHPSFGTLSLNGVRIDESPIAERVPLFSVAEQTPWFFQDTIRENLMIQNRVIVEEIVDTEIFRVLAEVGLAEHVASLPDGLSSMLMEGGSNFSGGELQRLSVARALLKEAPFLLFDEPTAGLDAINEKNLFNLIFQLAQEKGVLLITHRTHIDDLLMNRKSVIVEEVIL